MRPIAFYELCNILTRYNLVRQSKNMSIKEQVLLFVHCLGHNVKFCVLAGRFHRSSETCHRYFRIVLNVVLKLYKYVVKSPDDSTPPEIMNSRSLVKNAPPENEKELFNIRHSSLRTTTECGFGILKKPDPSDPMVQEVNNETRSRPERQTHREERENMKWLAKRDNMASAMWADYSIIRFTTVEMAKGKQFRWTKPMERLLLEILADEALKGNKPTNTFKTSSFTRVAESISLKFAVECTTDNVENHVKTVKSTWNVIATLRGKSGLGWDDTLKMITTERQSYEEEYLNRKIEIYDEMALVIGKDMATGSFAKSFVDVDMQENMNIYYLAAEEEGETEREAKGKQTISSTVTSSQARSHRKRNRDELPLDLVATQLGEIAIAISKLSRNELIVDDLYKEVMKIEGLEELVLVNAFDYLVENEKQAKAFM
ncbi:LOW QUALITY PROTEIN: Myb_DNA-bind_3 domain-containing protein, partial [Cephalotus follicularis]